MRSEFSEGLALIEHLLKQVCAEVAQTSALLPGYGPQQVMGLAAQVDADP